jgi:shikimate dehydrogenase
LHRAAYAGLGLDWTYEAREVSESELGGFLARLDGSWAGLSLTMPLKEAVIDLLAGVDDDARAIRSVNTVLPFGDGWRGANTDIFGITEALRRAGARDDPTTATVLGSGATARSGVAALARLGVRRVVVCARRVDQADAVAALASELGIVDASAASLQPDADLIAADIVISTLPGDAGLPWSDLATCATGALLDASYHPWPTPLSRAWGSPVVASGRDMLLWQAAGQVRLMTGLEPPVALMAAALPA